jgi:cobalt-zinc-cadmium efflux system outer membrane protein
MRLEIPQATADILAAGQRPNSFRFVVGGRDGPVLLRPLDLPPKRWARVLVARLAARAIEAQYRDAVRIQTGNLYTAYIDAQMAQMKVRIARANLTGIKRIMAVIKPLAERGVLGKADVSRIAVAQERAASMVVNAEGALRNARLTLGGLLNLSEAESERLEIRDEVGEDEPTLQTLEELTRLALRHHPDVRAYRFGLLRAYADWLRSWVEQWPDLYLLVGPNRPARPDAAAGAEAVVGASSLVASLPDTAHGRGKLERARINVAQTRVELAQAERQVVAEVRQAHLQYKQSRSVLQRLKENVVPSARQARDDALGQFQAGEIKTEAYLSAQEEYNKVIYQYIRALVGHRRSALALNTAVGSRVLP